MELQITLGEGPQIQSYTAGEFTIDDQSYHGSVWVHAEQSVSQWRPQTVEDLSADDVNDLMSGNPSLILLGTGTTLIFPPEQCFAALYEANIGLEIMDTAAACRTYNLLMSEGRDVLAALLSQ